MKRFLNCIFGVLTLCVCSMLFVSCGDDDVDDTPADGKVGVHKIVVTFEGQIGEFDYWLPLGRVCAFRSNQATTGIKFDATDINSTTKAFVYEEQDNLIDWGGTNGINKGILFKGFAKQFVFTSDKDASVMRISIGGVGNSFPNSRNQTFTVTLKGYINDKQTNYASYEISTDKMDGWMLGFSTVPTPSFDVFVATN